MCEILNKFMDFFRTVCSPNITSPDLNFSQKMTSRIWAVVASQRVASLEKVHTWGARFHNCAARAGAAPTIGTRGPWAQ